MMIVIYYKKLDSNHIFTDTKNFQYAREAETLMSELQM